MSNNDIVPGFDDTPIDGLHVRLSKAGELDGCLVVFLKGELGQQWGWVFQQQVLMAIGAGYLRLVFDLGELGYLSEDAGYPFADFLATVKHRGGDVVLVDIQPKVYKVLQIIGSSQLFNYMDGLEEAIAFCSGTSRRTPRGNDVIAPGFDDGRDECLKIRLHGVAGHSDGLLLSLTGYLDNSTSANVMNRITRAIDAGYLRLIFDMDGIDFMNNDGAGVLTAVLEAVKQHGGDIVLIRTPPKVREVLRILGCLPSLPIRKTFAEGIAYFSGRPEAAVDGNDVIVSGFPDAACENLEIRMRGLEKIPRGLLLTPRGYVDRFNHRCFASHIDRAIAAGYHRLVFDLRDVEWAGDAIITTMIGFLKAVKPLGGGVVLCNIQPAIMEVITLLGFPQFFNIKETLEQALEVFSCKPEHAPSSNDAIIPGFDDEKDDSLRIQLRKIDGLEHGLLLSLDGYVDSYNRQSFEQRVILAIDAGYSRLVFDMSGLNYSGDTGLGVFTAFLKRVKPRDGDIAFFGIPSRVFEVFQLLGFSPFFNIRETFDEAIAFFAIAGKPPEFPMVFKCPTCSHRVRTAKPGRFRCRTCKTILSVDTAGQVMLG